MNARSQRPTSLTLSAVAVATSAALGGPLLSATAPHATTTGPTVTVTSYDIGNGTGPVVLDRQRRLVYAGVGQGVAVFDEASATAIDLPLAYYPRGIAVGEKTGLAYVAEYWEAGSAVAILDGATVKKTLKLPKGSQPIAATFNAHTQRAFVLEQGANRVAVIKGERVVNHVSVGREPAAMVLDPKTQNLYVANSAGNSVTVIHDGHIIATRTVPADPVALGLDSTTHRVYVACRHANRVAVLQGTHVVATLHMLAKSAPVLVAVDSIHHEVVIGEHGTSTGSSADDLLYTGAGYTAIQGMQVVSSTRLSRYDSVDAVIADPATSSFIIGIGDQPDSDPSRVIRGDGITTVPFDIEAPDGIAAGTTIWMPGIAPDLTPHLEHVAISPSA